MNKTTNKIIASMLVLILTLAQLSIIGIYGKEVYATNSSLENQTVATNNKNVEFDAYFSDGEHTATKEISKENSIYAKISVDSTGYLKNAQIQFKGEDEENANFKLINKTEKTIIQKIDEENSVVTLNQIDSKTEQTIEIPIAFNYSEEILLSELSRENKVKLTGTYVDGKGEEKAIEKEILVKLNWKEETSAVLEETVTAFVPYTVESNEGILMQTTVKVNAENNALPVKTTVVEAKVPTINGIKPTSIKVYANSTKATNGQDSGVNFVKTNYAYNEETNILKIEVTNPIQNGKIKWAKQAIDEYKLTYIYPIEAKKYVAEQVNGARVDLDTSVAMELYDSNQTKVTRTVTQYDYYKQQLGDISQISIKHNEQSLSKGYIYANYVAEQKIETNYSAKIIAEVLAPTLTDKILVEQSEEYFMAKDGQTKYNTSASENSAAYYKTISISKALINKILGTENPEIKIYSGDTVIETIDKTKIDAAEETITIDLANKDINSIKIETSKPVAEGQLIFNIEKAIKGSISYTKANMETVEKLVTSIKATVNGKESASLSEISLTELEQKAQIVIDKENLSSIIKNENVQLKAILNTNSIENALYKDPIIAIKLPKSIEKVEIVDKDIMFDSELTIESINTVENADGSYSIVIQLKGEQTKYNIGSVTGGTNIVVTTNLTVNRLTANKTEQITMYYQNKEQQQNGEQAKEVNTNVNIVAPTGVVTTNSIEGYAEGKEKLTAISGEKITAELNAMQEEKQATFSMNVVNNYNNTIDGVKILGRLPFKGNKNLVTGEDLKSTFDITLKSAISVEGIDEARITIYYSTNAEATTDLSQTANAWTTTVDNYETVKSYLIIVDGTLNTADMISFSYTAQIPSNLEYNETAIENYIVYFNNNLATGIIQDKQLAVPIEITTGLGPVLQTTLESNYKENQVVAVGKYIDYTIKITNVGTLNAEGTMVTVALPEYTKLAVYNEQTGSYVTDYTQSTAVIDVGTIQVGHTIEKSIKVQVTTSSSSEQGHVDKITTKATVHASNISYEMESNEVVNSITKPFYRISNYSISENLEYSENEEFEFVIGVATSGFETTSQNTIVTIPLPSKLEYVSANVTSYNSQDSKTEEVNTKIEYDNNNNTIRVNVGELTKTISKTVNVKVKVGKLDQNEYKHVLQTYAEVSGDNISKETSDIKEYTVTKVGLEVEQTSNIPNGTTIQAGDELTYIINVKNIGQREAAITIKNTIPNGLTFKNLEYTINNETKISNSSEQYMVIGIGESATIKVNTIAQMLNENTNVVNVPVIEIKDLENIQVNSVSHTIERFEVPIFGGDEQEQPDETSNNKISGIIWEDTNKNGMYDSTEKLFSGIEVLLLNAETNRLFGQNVTTNENGVYTFDNVPQGKYIVIYLYDSGKYSATTYKADGVDETINSDAMDTQIILDGVTLNVAITNNITVEDKSIYNISLGLVENAKFDLKLNKTISKITVQDPTGTKVYDYNGDKAVKVEFVEKYLGQTTIVVEYKFTVTNEGAIEGYVKKIADYLPTAMSFSSELNRDWYTAENGTIYNASLANTKLMPGESKEVTLLLTKAVNKDNLGTISNTAEIYEAYNDKGITDYDSTVANKATNEDDFSSADIVLSVKTGKMITFVSLTLSIIIIIGTGAYFIKKKVLI